VLSLSDSCFYPAPVLLELADFKQVQASVFQVAARPGKTLVYLGAVLLISACSRCCTSANAGCGSGSAAAAADTRSPAAVHHPRTLDADAEFER
jgi:cytochrome c biogenesis protein